MLKLENVYTYSVGIFMYKFKSEMLPVIIIQQLFKKSSDVDKYSTRQSQSFYVPICRTTVVSKTIKFKGVTYLE